MTRILGGHDGNIGFAGRSSWGRMGAGRRRYGRPSSSRGSPYFRVAPQPSGRPVRRAHALCHPDLRSDAGQQRHSPWRTLRPARRHVRPHDCGTTTRPMTPHLDRFAAPSPIRHPAGIHRTGAGGVQVAADAQAALPAGKPCASLLRRSLGAAILLADHRGRSRPSYPPSRPGPPSARWRDFHRGRRSARSRPTRDRSRFPTCTIEEVGGSGIRPCRRSPPTPACSGRRFWKRRVEVRHLTASSGWTLEFTVRLRLWLRRGRS